MKRLLKIASICVIPGALQAAPLTGLTDIAAGATHSCAIAPGGTVKCWGHSLRLGILTTTAFQTSMVEAHPAPVEVPGLSGIAALEAGHEMTCAITATAGLKCWGTDPGTFSSHPPVDVTGFTSDVAQVSAGLTVNCLRSTGGGVFCWGNNSVGEVGDGTTILRPTPVAVVGLASGVSQVSAGFFHACAVTTLGAVKCWGGNTNGKLGDGTRVDRSSPIDVQGMASGAAAVAAGGEHTCALMGDGTVKCWGRIGVGASILDVPTEVPGLPPISAITSGGAFSCALTGSGVVLCWGSNAQGQLGDGTYVDRFQSPVQPLDLGTGVTAVSAGESHACALLASGEARCWGASGWGRLSSTFSHNTFLSVPIAVGDMSSQTTTFSEVATRSLGDPPFTVDASATSGLPVTFVSLTPSVCSVAATTVTIASAGVCSIRAHQLGDAQFQRANPTSRHFQVVEHAVPRLSNISTRGRVFTGTNSLIAGFVIGGTATKKVAIVATGPSLQSYGVQGVVDNPRITLVRSSDQKVVKISDFWYLPHIGLLTQASLEWFWPDFRQLEDLHLDPPYFYEPGLIADLPPGAYTAIVSSDGTWTGPGTSTYPTNPGGIGLVGVYELDRPEAPLINISTRGEVMDGENVMIAGFVVLGNAARKLAIVATGPSLAQHGIDNPLANPTLTLVRMSDQSVIATNDDWQTAANASQLQAAGFAPSSPLEAGILVTLPPGAYTAIVSGVGGGTGISVIGVYAVP
jgi:alpha-tubulin suppressor-like RCC1 family protein